MLKEGSNGSFTSIFLSTAKSLVHVRWSIITADGTELGFLPYHSTNEVSNVE